MDSLPEVLTRINTRIDTLEQRVFILEHPSDGSAALPAPEPVPTGVALAHIAESSSFAEAGATFPVFGKAMLGMAGAYVLRAIAESGSLPKLAVVVLAIAYAGMWMAWAAWIPARQWFASTIYAGTSALIFAPMLWELTLHFKVLSPSVAAALLGVFVIGAYALAWKHNLVSVVWVGVLTTALAATALLIATHEMGPFIIVLLLMALISEAASSRNHWLSVRPVVAAAADFAVWSMIFIYANPDTSRADYAPLSTAALLVPGFILLLIYGTSVGLRTTLLGQRITLFEAGQAIVAFLLAADAVLRFGPPQSAALFGIFCLLLAPACYTAVFVCFETTAGSRNYHVYSTWGLALLLSGSFLCLSQAWLASCLGAAAILSTVLAIRRSCQTLKFHGIIYLVAAAIASGLLQYSSRALAGIFPEPPAGIAWLVAGSTILCYAISGNILATDRKQRLFQTFSAILAVGAVATLLVSSLVWLTATVITPGESHVAVIRTLTACALALTLAYFGPRWERIELVWVSYGTLALVAAKLIFEDLRQGHPEFIAASIFLYAVTLMLIPRLARQTTKKLGTTAPSDK